MIIHQCTQQFSSVVNHVGRSTAQSFFTRIIDKYLPTRVFKSHKDVPWLNQFIKQKTRLHNKLYVCAKHTQTESDWFAYRHGE